MPKFYPENVSKRFDQPHNAGEAASANGVGTGAAMECGSVIRFTLRIDGATKKIETVRFTSNGCGFMVAAADVIADAIRGRRLTELHGLAAEGIIPPIEFALHTFPNDRKHCISACAEALHSAFADFRSIQLEEFRGEKALICTCFGVSEETIEAKIRELSLTTVEAVGRVCNAGMGCGSCHMMIREMLDSADE